MKRFLSMIALLAMLSLLAGCDSGDYKDAMTLYEGGDYEIAAEIFTRLEEYKDSAEMAVKCEYALAKRLAEQKEYPQALDKFSALGDYADSAELMVQCRLEYANSLYESGAYAQAIEQLRDLEQTEQVGQQLRQCAWAVLREYLSEAGPVEVKDSQYDVEKTSQVETLCTVTRQGNRVEATVNAKETVSYPILSASHTTVTNTVVSFDGKELRPELEAKSDMTFSGVNGTSLILQNIGTCFWDLAVYKADTPVVWEEYIHIGQDGTMDDTRSAPAFDERVTKQQTFIASCLEQLLEDANSGLTMADLGFTDY